MHKHALVIGKMLNTHKGHQALLRYAKTLAEKVTLLLCVTPDDRVPGDTRVRWLSNTFGNSIEIKVFNYLDHGLEGGEESDDDISKCWAEWVDENMPTVDLLVGSEDYVTYMANHGSFDADIYDMERTTNPCSSTQVSQGDYSNYIHSAKSELAKKVYILGAESSGKTTAAIATGDALDCEVVIEQARGYLDKGGAYSMEDLDVFALAQDLEVRLRVRDADTQLMVIDTSAITTLVYSMMQFGECSDILTALVNEEDGLYILMSPEVPWVNDGTRCISDVLDREDFFLITLDIMVQLDKNFYVISGTDYEERLQGVLNVIKSI